MKASLLAEPESIQPGQRFWVGIRLQMEDGWHTYWKNPADSGLPTRMSWRLPGGFRAGPLQWPYPARLAAPPLVSYGYEGDVLLPVEIAAPRSLVTGSHVRLEGRVDWLECQEACIPGKAEVAVTLPVRAEAPRPAPAAAPLFAEAPREAYFFAAQPLVIEYAAPQPLRPAEGGQRLELRPAANAPQPLARLVGVLLTEGRAPLRGRGGRVALEVDVPVARVAALPPAPSREGGLPPLYVPYGRDSVAAPRLLPEVITPGIVLGAIEETLQKKEKSTMFIINPEGKLVYNGAIDDKPSTDTADIAAARNYVATALDEAMAGKPVTTASSPPYGCSVKY